MNIDQCRINAGFSNRLRRGCIATTYRSIGDCLSVDNRLAATPTALTPSLCPTGTLRSPPNSRYMLWIIISTFVANLGEVSRHLHRTQVQVSDGGGQNRINPAHLRGWADFVDEPLVACRAYKEKESLFPGRSRAMASTPGNGVISVRVRVV